MMSDVDDKNNELLKEFGNHRVPSEVIKSRTGETGETEKNKNNTDTYLCLFYSFDIVNSTAYKSATTWWPVIIKELIGLIRRKVSESQYLLSSSLWRVIGDEAIFVIPIQDDDTLVTTIDAIFRLLQEIVVSIKTGDFVDGIQNQRIKGDEDLLKYQTRILSLKGAAWIAPIVSNSDRMDARGALYNNISFDYPGTTQSQEMHEYLGRDIDAGFRVKQYTMGRRLALSYELAYLLKDKRCNNLYIIDYVKLHGVWDEKLYPIIWYYNPKTIASLEGDSEKENDIEKTYGFNKSFRYDETGENPIVSSYFKRVGGHDDMYEKDGVLLEREMYNIEYAFDKLARDRNLEDKIEYLRSLYTSEVDINAYVDSPLELHIAVVCYDPKQQKIMIAKRSDEHSLNKRKWDFGCAKATSHQHIIESVKEYYKNVFALEIEPIIDNIRQESQPRPVAVYEIEKNDQIKKGIIIMANVIKKSDYRSSGTYKEIKWVDIDEAKKISEETAVRDFHNTIKFVFEHIKDK